MKFSIFGILFLLIFLSCQKKTTEPSCHILNIGSPYEIEFTEGIAHNFYFSPFDRQKVFIEMRNSKEAFLEYNLTDRSFTTLDRNSWKIRNPSNAPSYIDYSDSTIWVGGRRELKKISMKTNQITTLPIKYVTRIIPYQSYIYFAANKGFFKWDKKNKSYEKIDLPFRNYPVTHLLNEETLIFGNNLTYDLKKNSWKKGVHIYDYHWNVNSLNFKIEKGIGAFGYGNDSIKLIFPTESRIVPIGYKPKLLNIQLPFIWKNSKQNIIQYNIEKNQLDTFHFTVPFASDRNTRYNFINRKERTWIFKKDKLYILNMLTNEKYKYKFETNEKFISLRVDDCNMYLLFENKLIIKNKETFIQECTPFDDKKYLTQLKEFRKFRDSTKIPKEKNEDEVLKKLALIKSKYGDYDHPGIQKELKKLNIYAFNSVQYETSLQLEACMRNNQIPIEKRKQCYQFLISKEVRSSNFKNAISLEKEFFSKIDVEDFDSNYSYYTSLDSVKKYLAVVDSLENLNLLQDSLDYQKAMAIKSVCRTSFFCHEGCGGCDFSLVVLALNDFIKIHPNSELRDNAEYDILRYSHMYLELQGELSVFIRDFDTFIEKNPDSDLTDDAHFTIIQNIFYLQENQKDKTSLLERVFTFEERFPDSKHQKWIQENLKNAN